MDRLLYAIESLLKRQMTRKAFLKYSFGAALFLISQNQLLKIAFAKTAKSKARVSRRIKEQSDVFVAEGNNSYDNTVRVIQAMGGMQRFVKKGDTVVVKPNMAWDRTPEQAANTDPQVVAALVGLAYDAGAKKVNVFDVPCNDDRRVYERSGIQQAAKQKGANVFFADHWNVIKASFDYKSPMEDWPILRDAVDCDCFINVPVLKDHALTKLTLSIKNLMGVCSGTRGTMHAGIGRKLADLADFINPDLTVIDATRVLTRNGPSGGNVDDVIVMDKVIASTDPVMADAFAASLMKIDPKSISYIRESMERGLGELDISKAKVHIA